MIELNIKDVLLKIFNETDNLIILDIGSCEGEDSIKYSNLFPNAVVYSFEPRIDNFNYILKNISLFNKTDKVIPFNLALSNQDGFATFYLSSGRPEDRSTEIDWDFGNKSSSLLQPSSEIKKTTPWLEFNKEETVKTQRLDNFLLQNGIEIIDFVHLDVQGAELLVLDGCGQKISKIKAIWMEVELIELYKGQPLKDDIEKFMYLNKFVCIKSDVDAVSGDQLYINRQYFTKKQINNISFKNNISFRKKIKKYIKRIVKW